MLKKLIPSILFLALATVSGLSAQEIVTGADFFTRVADNYGNIEDYNADFEMVIDGTTMSGIIYYKSPNLIRIDFTDPRDQVLVSDGKMMQVYVPHYNVTLTQSLRAQPNPGLVSESGLKLMKQNYQIAFKDSPDLQPLNDNDPNSEMVYKLRLTWRTTAQGFREIELDVTPDLYIRRMSAVTADRRDVQFTFKSIQINQNIPDARFDYDSPPSSNNYDNFLYGAE